MNAEFGEYLDQIRELQPQAYSISRGVGLTNEEAEDAIQDQNLQFARSGISFKNYSKFSTWYYQCIINRSERIIGSRKNHLPLTDEGGIEKSYDLKENDQSKSIREKLARINPLFAEVIRLVEFEEISYSEAATRLGIPEVTARTRSYRGRNELKALLQREGIFR